MGRRLRNRKILYFFIRFILLLGLCILLVHVLLPQTTFIVNAHTEWLRVTSDTLPPKIALKDVRYFPDFTDKTGKSFSGYFEPAIGSTLEFERVTNNVLKLKIAADSSGIMGRFYDMNDALLKYNDEFENSKLQKLSFCVDSTSTSLELFFPAFNETRQRPVVIPFRGKVETGRNLYYRSLGSSPALLESGSIRLIGQSICRSYFYESSSRELYFGDQVLIEDNHDDPVNAYGLLRADASGLRLVYKALGKKARIFSQGPVARKEGFVIKQSLLGRFANDNAFKWFAWFIAAVLVLGNLIEYKNESDTFLERNFARLIRKRKKKKKNRKK